MISCRAQVSLSKSPLSLWNVTLELLCPKDREQAVHPCAILRPRKWFLILLNCAKLKFVSYTSNWLEQMYDFRECTMFHLKWILNPQDYAQSLSLEINPIDNAEPCYRRENIVGSHLCGECMKSFLPIVCHMPASILWLVEQVWWLTIECQVSQFVPNTSILKTHCEHTCDNSPTDFISSSLKWWSSMHGVDTL